MNAVILGHSGDSLAIAGVPLLDRQVMALFRGGCAKVTVVGCRWLSGLPRSTAHGFEVEHCRELSGTNEPTLVVLADVLFEGCDVTRLLEAGGRLESSEGVLLNIGIVPAASISSLLPQLVDQPILRASGVAMQVRDNEDRRWAARELWGSLGSSTDGVVDTLINRPLGRNLSKVLVHTNITPNQVSLVAIMVGALSALSFAVGGYWTAVAGALLLQLSAIIDCVDGDLARIVFKESPLGKWLDLVGDQFVHIAVFIGIGIGLWRTEVDAPVALLAASAAIGVVISFAVVLRGMSLPESPENALLHTLINKMTNRDFSVILLALAVVNQLSLFLWMVGIGVHVFWILAMAAQLIGRRQSR